MNTNSGEPGLTDKQKMMVIAGFILTGLILVAFFGFRASQSLIRLEKRGLTPGAADVEGIRGWMTVAYVSTVFRVPSDYIFQQAGIPAEGNEKKSIRELGQDYFPDQPTQIMDKIKAAILHYLENPPVHPAVPVKMVGVSSQRFFDP